MKLKNITELYRASPDWTRLTINSRRVYEGGIRTLKRFMEMDADKITRPMIMDFKDEIYEQRGKCRVALTTLSNILSYGYDRGLVKFNHAASIKNIPPSIPWKRWDMKDIMKVMKVAPEHIRDVIMLALYTGQRRSDLIEMRWDNYDGTYIHIIQIKTKKRLAIPVHPILKEELERMKARGGEFILTHTKGTGWEKASVSRAVSTWAKAARAPHVLHGLRKTTASCLAELGCTPHEIAAITGQSLKEVMAYTAEADQKTMANSAIGRWS